VSLLKASQQSRLLGYAQQAFSEPGCVLLLIVLMVILIRDEQPNGTLGSIISTETAPPPTT